MLRLAPDLELPDDFVTQSSAILARRGAGKTYTALKLMEQLIGAGLPVVALDPLGVMWGLRSSADGEGPGLPVTILGGAHGDVPLEPTGGRAVATFVVEHPGAYVLDLSGFESNAAQDRFAADFAETLYRAKGNAREALLLVVDEADSFAPQRPGKSQLRMLGAFEAIVRRGRARGLGAMLISQRPAVLNKNVLSQIELLIALQVTAPQDRKALDEWAQGWSTPTQRKAFLDALAQLTVGEAWVWSPTWLETFRAIRVAPRETFDSSATPKAGEQRAEPRVLADVDLDALRTAMADSIERAEADDPKRLKAEIVRLSRELDQARADIIRAPVATPEPVEVMPAAAKHATVLLRAAVGEAHGAIYSELDVALDRARALVEAYFDEIEAYVTALEQGAQAEKVPLDRAAARPARAAGPAAAPKPAPRRDSRTSAPRAPVSGNPDVGMGKAETAFLTVLVQHGPQDRAPLATLAGYSVKSRHVDNTVGRLRSAGYVTDGWPASATDAGIAALGEVEPLPTGAALRAYWLAHPRVPGAGRKMLEVLFDAWPESLTRDEVGERAGFSVTSRHVDNTLGTLRTLGLAVGGREAITANPLLMGP